MSGTGSKIRATIIAILIFLLVAAFAVWGVEDVFNPQAGNNVIKIGKEEVSSNEFRRAFDFELSQRRQESGSSLTNEQAAAQGIHRQVLTDLLGQKTFEVDATDLGIGYNARSARKDLALMDVFQDPITKEFSAEQVDMVMARQDPPMTRFDFAEDLERRMRLEQILPAITRGIDVPDAYAENYYNFIRETRDVSILTLQSSAVDAAPEPTDAQLQTFIDENIIKFTLPEFRRVTLLRMEPTEFVYVDDIDRLGLASEENARAAFNNVFITDEEIDTQYEIKIASENLTTPATRSLTIYFTENEDTAKQVAEKVKEGLTQSEIMSLFGLNEPTSYEDAEASDIIDPEVAEVSFEMKEGDVRTIHGGFDQWVAVHVTAAVEEFKPARDSVEDDIIVEILENKAQNEIYKKMDLIQDAIDDGRTLEEAAEIVGVPFAQLPFVNRFGATQDELTLQGLGRLPGVANDNEIMKSIFTANPGIEVDVFETSGGGQATLRVDNVIESQPKSFEASKSLATVMWKEEYVDNALEELSAEIMDRISDGEALSAIAEEMGDKAVLSTYTLSRLSPQPEIGTTIWSELIEAEEGDRTRGLGPQKLTRQVAVLDKIIPNTEPATEQDQSFLQDRINAQLANDILLAYQNAIHAETPYNINEDRVNAILGINTPSE